MQFKIKKFVQVGYCERYIANVLPALFSLVQGLKDRPTCIDLGAGS